MKTWELMLVLFCTLATGAVAVKAQESPNAISVDLFLPAMSPVSRLSGEAMRFVPVNVMYQRVLAEHQVLMLKLGFTYNWNSAGDRILETNPMLALDWHPFDSGLQGFHVGPALFFNYSAYSYADTAAADDPDYSYWIAMGGNIGYGFLRPSNRIMDLVFGIGRGYSKEVDMNGEVISSHQTDETIGGVFVGYRF